MTPPLEPLYTLKVAAERIPFRSAKALKDWLYKRPDAFPPRYQYGRYHRLTRLLSLAECTQIRTMTVFGKERVNRRRRRAP